MKVGIEKKELVRLLNRDTELNLLEEGGVDNWDWYGVSLKDLDSKKITSIDAKEFEEKYYSGDTVFYNNNPAEFISYLNDRMAVVVVSMRPNFDESFVYGSCMGCAVGDSDNKLRCTCDETAWVVEQLDSQTEDTLHPLIVDVRMLHDKPLKVIEWEKDILALNSEKDRKREELKKMAVIKIKLDREIAEAKEVVEAMKLIDGM